MKIDRIYKLSIVLYSLFACSSSFAQLDPWYCGTPGGAGGSGMMGKIWPQSAFNPASLFRANPNPVGKNFKIAALYFKLSDDGFNSGDCQTQGWSTSSSSPSWMGQFLISTPYNAATVESDIAAKPNSLTSYWYRMSNGNLWLWGDEHVYAGPAITRSSDDASKASWRANNQAILQWYVNNYNLNSLDNNGDGLVDMIMLICRARAKYPYFIGGQNYTGVADGDYLPSPVTISDALNPTEPDIRGEYSLVNNSGVYGTDCYNLEGTRPHIAHELGHQLWNSGHRNGVHRWNLMSGAGSTPPTKSGIVPNAFDKSVLGWLTFTTTTTDQVAVELSALSSSNQAIRIPVNNPGATTDYFVLEYRKNITYFEIVTPSTCTDAGLGEGLLISYMQSNISDAPLIRPADNNVAFVGSPPVYKDGDASDLFPNGGITKITPYTSPNTADRSGNRTGLAILNIQYSGAGNEKVKFDIRQNYWEGAISSNATWSGQVFVGGDITVNSGVTLTISDGTTVLFASGKRIKVNGNLQVQGTVSQAVVFDRAGTSGTWNGIWIENSSANSNLNYCTVRNATTGIRLKNTSGTVTIDHATLTANQIGFVSEYSSPFTVQNSTIQNNIAYGIWITSSAASGTMKILSNIISSNGTTHGVHLYNGADAYLGFNTITGHSQHGVSCHTNSDPYMRSASPSPDYGNNTITNNGGAGVKAMNNSHPLLGVNFQDGTLKDYYGYNEIHSNTGYEIENANSSGTIMAERNYWSANHTIQATPSDLYGSVDYDPVLPEGPLLVAGWNMVSLKKSSIDFEEAFALENQGAFQSAADSYLKLLESDPGADNVGFGVSGLIRCYKGMDRREEISELMDHLINLFSQTALAASAKDHSLPYLVQRGEHDLALTRVQELLLQSRENLEAEPSLLFQAAAIYRLKSADQAGADFSNALDKYHELVQKYPDSDLAFFVRLELAELGDSGFGKPEKRSLTILLSQKSFELKANYPNPFNPETSIKFLLAEEQQVQLYIFDASGRLVRTLLEGSFPKGERKISWNGRDDRGIAVANGVYLYKLIVGQQSQTRKMVLLR